MRLRVRACALAVTLGAIGIASFAGPSGAATSRPMLLPTAGTTAATPVPARASAVQPAVTPPSATVIPPGTTLPFNRI